MSAPHSTRDKSSVKSYIEKTFFSPVRTNPSIRNMREGFIDLGACGRGGLLTKKDKLSLLGITDAKFKRLTELEQMKKMREVNFIVSEQNIVDSFYTVDNTSISKGRANQIREDFVCSSLYKISKNLDPHYSNKQIINLFNQLKSEIRRQKLDIVDAMAAGGGGESHDVKILIRGKKEYSTLELKTTQQRCKDDRMPWSCTQQFQSKLLMSSHRIKIMGAKNDGELYLKGWYEILKKLDANGDLFTPPGQLPNFATFMKEVNQSMPKTTFWINYFKGMQMKKIYLKDWNKKGIPGMTLEEKTKKMNKIDRENHVYTNNFLKKYIQDINLNQIQKDLKSVMTGKDYWLTWSTKDEKFTLYKGSPTMYISDSSLEYVGSSDNIRYGYYLIKVYGIEIDDKPLKTFVALRLQWSNRITQPAWRFSYVKNDKNILEDNNDDVNRQRRISKKISTKTTPAKTTLAKTTLAKTTLAKTTPAKTTPMKTTPMKTTPMKTTPTKTTPTKTTAKIRPVKTTIAKITSNNIMHKKDYKKVKYVQQKLPFKPIQRSA